MIFHSSGSVCISGLWPLQIPTHSSYGPYLTVEALQHSRGEWHGGKNSNRQAYLMIQLNSFAANLTVLAISKKSEASFAIFGFSFSNMLKANRCLSISCIL